MKQTIIYMCSSILTGRLLSIDGYPHRNQVKISTTLQLEYFISSLILEFLIAVLVIVLLAISLWLILKTTISIKQTHSLSQHPSQLKQNSNFEKAKQSHIVESRFSNMEGISILIISQNLNSNQKNSTHLKSKLKRKLIQFNNRSQLIMTSHKSNEDQATSSNISQSNFFQLQSKKLHSSVLQESNEVLAQSKKIQYKSENSKDHSESLEGTIQVNQHKQQYLSIFLVVERKIYFLLCYLSISLFLLNLMKYGYICALSSIIGIIFYVTQWIIGRKIIKIFFLGFITPIIGIWFFSNFLY